MFSIKQEKKGEEEREEGREGEEEGEGEGKAEGEGERERLSGAGRIVLSLKANCQGSPFK